jgi:hypothetical protein
MSTCKFVKWFWKNKFSYLRSSIYIGTHIIYTVAIGQGRERDVKNETFADILIN